MKKKILLYIGIVLGLLVIAYAFTPEVITGKIVNQSDISGWRGMAQESIEWNKAHPDDKTAWSGSMFGGMPNVATINPTEGDLTRYLHRVLYIGGRPASYLFISLLGAFLLMLSLGISPLLAAGGAIAVTFCAYNPQIIQVGHNTKMQAIAFMPWVMAAVVFTYRNALNSAKWLPKVALGAALFGLALSFQIKCNHPQISYYLAIVILTYAIVHLIWILAGKERRQSLLKRYFSASAALLLLGVVGIATNATNLIPTLEYTPYSMRGGSSADAQGNKEREGLDIDYATAWSYGWEELPNMVIPNFNGGSCSQAVNPKHSATYDLFKRAGQPADRICKSLPMYWGPQPFTAGPMYMGAVSFLLFILGLLYYRDKNRWWILVSSVFCLLLALGSHFMWFTRICMDALPMYNKFRTVSMALVALQMTVPIMGFLMLNSMAGSTASSKVLRRQVTIASAAAVGFCLLMAAVQSLFGSFASSADAGMQEVLVEAFQKDRHHLLWADTWRSIAFIAASGVVLFWGCSEKNRRMTASVVVSLLLLVDLFAVGKRYLNSDHFTTPTKFESQFTKRPVDADILTDTDPSYRVIDLTVSMFNDSHASYWHKNVGGYSPVKMQRYQEFIDKYLVAEIQTLAAYINNSSGTLQEVESSMPYLEGLASMNCRYIIVSDNQKLTYPHARGNAWFESSTSSSDRVVLDSYAPNCLKYTYTSEREQTLVFSEVYYPNGWTLTIDGGEELPISLYEGSDDTPEGLLRCAVVPAGNHTLQMRYAPASYQLGRDVSLICSLILISVIVLVLLLMILGKLKERKALRS